MLDPDRLTELRDLLAKYEANPQPDAYLALAEALADNAPDLLAAAEANQFHMKMWEQAEKREVELLATIERVEALADEWDQEAKKFKRTRNNELYGDGAADAWQIAANELRRTALAQPATKEADRWPDDRDPSDGQQWGLYQ